MANNKGKTYSECRWDWQDIGQIPTQGETVVGHHLDPCTHFLA